MADRQSEIGSQKSDISKEMERVANEDYLAVEKHAELTQEIIEVGKMLGSMLNNPAPLLLKSNR